MRAQRDLGRALGREPQCLVTAVAVEGLGAAEDRRHGLKRHPDDVVVRLLCRQRAAGGLRVKAQLLRAWLGGAESVAHQTRPQPPCGAKLRDLLEEVVVRREEEGQPAPEHVHVEPRRDGRVHVGGCVGEGERHFLDRRCACLTDVIAADRHRMPAW